MVPFITASRIRHSPEVQVVIGVVAQMIGCVRVEAYAVGDRLLHDLKIENIRRGKAAGVVHQVAEDDVLNVGAFRPIVRQVVDDLSVDRDALLDHQLRHGYGGDQLAHAGHVQLYVRSPALTAILRSFGPLPLLGEEGLAVLTKLRGVAGNFAHQCSSRAAANVATSRR